MSKRRRKQPTGEPEIIVEEISEPTFKVAQLIQKNRIPEIVVAAVLSEGLITLDSEITTERFRQLVSHVIDREAEK